MSQSKRLLPSQKWQSSLSNYYEVKHSKNIKLHQKDACQSQQEKMTEVLYSQWSRMQCMVLGSGLGYIYATTKLQQSILGSTELVNKHT